MKKEYDFTNAKSNPYAKRLKQQVTINLDRSAIAYFKAEASRTNIPYQTLINLFLTDAASKKKKINLSWN
jgi:predicted DNA binding CopG/RHH family protein